MSSVRRLLSGIASIMMMIIGGRITIMLVLARRTMIMRRSSVAVMPEGHANAGAYGRNALDGNGQDQHGKGKRAEQALEHRTGLYVRSLERRSHESVPPSGLLLAAHAARRFIKRDAVRIAPEYPPPMEHEGVRDVAMAVRRGAVEWLLPILMTALAAGLALIPLALSAGAPGSEIQAPMAMVILFGLLSSTALNAFVLPALYLRFGASTK